MDKATQCVHSGTRPDPTSGGLNTPIHTSSAHDYRGRADIPYPRYFNTPNQTAVMDKLCALEGAESGVLFGSGMAAMSTAILSFAGAGDHVVLMDELYGGTHAFVTDEFARLGIDFTFAGTSAQALCDAVGERTRLIVIESPTNPLLSVVDLRKVAAFARQHNILTLIDNTFATPICQNPLELGLDLVVHSGTKYLGGHSDLSCGAVLGSKELIDRVLTLARHLGGSMNGLTCGLLERSLKTLALRVRCQSDNAMQVAHFLDQHDKVSRVYYPGLPLAPGHDIARGQMNGFGGMLSFEVTPDVDPKGFIDQLRLIRPAISLGGVESSIGPPALTSHAKISAAERRRIGISDRLFRFSTGIEDSADLIADLEQALNQPG